MTGRTVVVAAVATVAMSAAGAVAADASAGGLRDIHVACDTIGTASSVVELRDIWCCVCECDRRQRGDNSTGGFEMNQTKRSVNSLILKTRVFIESLNTPIHETITSSFRLQIGSNEITTLITIGERQPYDCLLCTRTCANANW